jgi:hypothetical protein
MKPAIFDASARQRVGEPSPVRHGTAIGTIGGAVLTSPRSSAKLPAWPIGRRKIYELAGASCIALDRRSGSVAIC